jgi:hypothetical protein
MSLPSASSLPTDFFLFAPLTLMGKEGTSTSALCWGRMVVEGVNELAFPS